MLEVFLRFGAVDTSRFVALGSQSQPRGPMERRMKNAALPRLPIARFGSETELVLPGAAHLLAHPMDPHDDCLVFGTLFRSSSAVGNFGPIA